MPRESRTWALGKAEEARPTIALWRFRHVLEILEILTSVACKKRCFLVLVSASPEVPRESKCQRCLAGLPTGKLHPWVWPQDLFYLMTAFGRRSTKPWVNPVLPSRGIGLGRPPQIQFGGVRSRGGCRCFSCS